MVKNPPAMQETQVQSLGQEDPLEKGLFPHSSILAWTILWNCKEPWAFLVAQMVKNPPAMQEIWVRSLGWEDPLEEGMATHTSILAWRISMDREAWWAIAHGVTKSLDTTE